MNPLKIAVLFGGCSEEHAVSVKSAKQIAICMDRAKYVPYFIYINRSGAWRLCDQETELRLRGESPDADAGFTGVPVVISPDRNDCGILIPGEDGCGKLRIDAVFPVIHGKMGEDGMLQGLLELSGIPYVGCDVASSVLCMDKSLTYSVVRNAGVSTPAFHVLHDGDAVQIEHDTDAAQTDCRADAAVRERFGYPVFVKPVRSGSSFGVGKVHAAAELEAAVETARRYDGKTLIEEAVAGCEIGCAVLGNGTDLTVGEPDMITLRNGFFKIHQEANPEAGSENATVTVPADIPQATGERVRETAKKVYRALGCAGLARVDMFLRESGGIVLNEVNTMPGFTSYSRYPRMMAAAGIPLPELIDRLIALALMR
ncbi:MAG: D-alanine--D-alanine ligase [Clostridiales Family XIII bacterium]|nr:D-alanine--D-alanine ligase [Clostridiales Family XIII bacterium]